MRMQRVTYFAGGLPGTVLSIGSAVAFFYGGLRVIEGTLTLGTMGAFLAYQMRVFAAGAGADGIVREPDHRQGVVGAGARDSRREDRCVEAPMRRPSSIRRARLICAVSLGTDRNRAYSTTCRSLRDRDRRLRWSAAAVSASRRSLTSRRACSIRTPASCASTDRICGADARERSPVRRPRRAGADAALRHHRGEHSLRAAGRDDRGCQERGRGGGHRAIHPRLARRLRDAGWRARPCGVGRRASTHRPGARVSCRSRGPRDG